jgi:hypothetical protein
MHTNQRDIFDHDALVYFWVEFLSILRMFRTVSRTKSPAHLVVNLGVIDAISCAPGVFSTTTLHMGVAPFDDDVREGGDTNSDQLKFSRLAKNDVHGAQ